MLLPTGHSFLLVTLIVCEDQLLLPRGHLLRLCACGQHLTAEPEQTLCFLIFLSLWGKENETLMPVPPPDEAASGSHGSAPTIDMGLERLVPTPHDQSFSSGCPRPGQGAEGLAAHPDQLHGQTPPGHGPGDHTHRALGHEPELRAVTDLLQALFSLLPPDLLLLDGGSQKGDSCRKPWSTPVLEPECPSPGLFASGQPALPCWPHWLQHGQQTLSPRAHCRKDTHSIQHGP